MSENEVRKMAFGRGNAVFLVRMFELIQISDNEKIQDIENCIKNSPDLKEEDLIESIKPVLSDPYKEISSQSRYINQLLGYLSFEGPNITAYIVRNISDQMVIRLTRQFLYLIDPSPTIGFKSLLPRILDLDLNAQKLIFTRYKKITKSFAFENIVTEFPNGLTNNSGIFFVARLLYNLRVEAETLKSKNETVAANNALDLHKKLNDSFKNYLKNPAENDEEAFKKLKNIWNNAFSTNEFEKHSRCEDIQTQLFFLVNSNFKLSDAEFQVIQELIKLRAKANDLEIHKHENAFSAADVLHTSLSKSFLDYLSHPKKELSQYQELRKQWVAAIALAKPELEMHRGWKNFLANLFLIIITMGIVHLGAAITEKITGNKYLDSKGLFSLTTTDSMQHLHRLDEIVSEKLVNDPMLT